MIVVAFPATLWVKTEKFFDMVMKVIKVSDTSVDTKEAGC